MAREKGGDGTPYVFRPGLAAGTTIGVGGVTALFGLALLVSAPFNSHYTGSLAVGGLCVLGLGGFLVIGGTKMRTVIDREFVTIVNWPKKVRVVPIADAVDFFNSSRGEAMHAVWLRTKDRPIPVSGGASRRLVDRQVAALNAALQESRTPPDP